MTRAFTAPFTRGIATGITGTTLPSVISSDRFPAWMAKDVGNLTAPSGFIYVRKTTAGTADGSSWANASSFTNPGISTLVTNARVQNKHILVRADEGEHTPPVNVSLNSTGTSRDFPVVIRGVDVNGNDMVATITGDRAQPFSPGATQGSPWLRLNQAAYLTFSYLKFKAWGNGALQFITDAVSDIAVLDCQGENLYRCLENVISGDALSASPQRVTVRRFTGNAPGGFERGFSRFRYDTADLFFEDVFVDGNQNIDDPFQAGLVFANTCHRVICRRVESGNFQVPSDTDSGLYWNGDAFSNERGNYSFMFEDCLGYSCTDGGYDCKGTNLYFRRCVGRDNKNNWRSWGDAVLENCESYDPLKRGGTGAQSHFNVPQDTTPSVWNYASTVRDTDAGSVVYHVQGGSTLFASDANDIVTAGTVEDNEASTITYFTPGGTVPVITSSAAQTVAEMEDFSITLTANTDILYWEVVGGVDRDLFELDGWFIGRSGVLTLAAKDYESPIDSDANNTYKIQIQAVTPTFARSAIKEFTVTVTDVIGDEGGDAWHVRPVPHGSADGSTWANAFGITSLNSAIGLAAIDHRPVWIRSDEQYVYGSAFFSSVSITNGGADQAHPVVIEGRDAFGDLYEPIWDTGDAQLLNPMFVGNRTFWTLPSDPEVTSSISGWSVGPTLFTLNSTANNIKWSYLGFTRFNQPFNMQGCTNPTFEDIDFFNCRESFFMDSTHGDVVGLVSRRIKAVGFSKRVHRCRADSNNWLIEDFYFNSGRQDRDDFASGILLDGTAHDITVNGTVPGGKYSGTICNCHTNEGTNAYWQGDGIQTERTNYNVFISRVTCHGNADGGFDLKSPFTTLTDTIAYDCKRNYRLWGVNDVYLDNCEAYSPNLRGGSGGPDNLYIGQNGRIAIKNSTSIHDGDIALENDAILWLDATTQSSLSNVSVSTPGIDGPNNPSVTFPGYVLMLSSLGQLRTWDPTNTTTPVAVTSSTTPSVNEGANFSQTVTLNSTLEYIEVKQVIIPDVPQVSGPAKDTNYWVGADAGFFGTSTPALTMAHKDYEHPSDANTDNNYEVTLRVYSTGLKWVDQNIVLSVADVATEPWQFIGISTAATAASGNSTLTEPSGLASGDHMVACIAYRDSAAFSAPSGWTKVAEETSSTDTTHVNSSSSNAVMFYTIRGSSAPTLVFPRTGGSVAIGSIVGYRNANPTPLDVSSHNLTIVQSTTTTCPTITTSENNELIVSMISLANQTGSNPKFHDWTALVDPNTASPNPGALDTADPAADWKLRGNSINGTAPGVGLGIADAVKATAGITGQFSAINSQTAKNSMITAAFKRAVP